MLVKDAVVIVVPVLTPVAEPAHALLVLREVIQMLTEQYHVRPVRQGHFPGPEQLHALHVQMDTIPQRALHYAASVLRELLAKQTKLATSTVQLVITRHKEVLVVVSVLLEHTLRQDLVVVPIAIQVHTPVLTVHLLVLHVLLESIPQLVGQLLAPIVLLERHPSAVPVAVQLAPQGQSRQ